MAVCLGAFVLLPGSPALASTGSAGGTAQDQVQAVRVEKRPKADRVGGFQLSFLGGVQLRGSASGQGGIAIAYFKPSTAAVGIELEGGFTAGPTGNVTHGLFSLILQSGVRSSRMVPYVAIGGGFFHARENLRSSLADALPDFGVNPVEGSETGPLFAFGFGIRYYLATKVSFRADYREFKAFTNSSGSVFDRLFSMRRIAGFLSFDF